MTGCLKLGSGLLGSEQAAELVPPPPPPPGSGVLYVLRKPLPLPFAIPLRRALAPVLLGRLDRRVVRGVRWLGVGRTPRDRPGTRGRDRVGYRKITVDGNNDTCV